MNFIGDHYRKSKKKFVLEEMFWQNEIQANKMTAIAMIMTIGFVIAAIVLATVNVFKLSSKITLYATVLELIVPVALCHRYKGAKSWLKFLMLFEYVAVLSRLTSVLDFYVSMTIVIPVIISTRYYSKKFTVWIASTSAIMYILSATASSLFGMGITDFNIYSPYSPLTVSLDATNVLQDVLTVAADERWKYFGQYMLYSCLPRYFVFSIVCVVCIKITERGHDLVVKQAEISGKTAAIEAELNVASSIQTNLLPNIFPAFPELDEIDIYATMKAAKEVGGDFYDYYKIDDSHIYFLIADVSGKGVPAALFMVIAKTIIKNYAQMHLEPKEVFNKVNNVLCDGNTNDMFVTSWIGLIDLKTGEVKYTNAGHNPPVFYHDGEITMLRSTPDLVLAGCEDFEYHQYSFTMDPGDKLFLYTDGVTEANNADKELYLEERLLKFSKEHVNMTVEDFLPALKADIDDFVGEAPQFDDITMVGVEFFKKQE